jgi:DNA-binding NarL/FixJ family response regulator
MRVMLADDHRMFRQGLKTLLGSREDIDVIAEASDGREAVEMASSCNPDVIIMDVSMPGLNGIEATRKITTDQPGVKIIGLSMHTDRRYTSELLKAGAAAYVPKDGAFEELEQAVRSVMSGEVYLSPRVAAGLVDDYVRQPQSPAPSVFERLTAREREVLQLMAEGQATKEIAATLHVSVKTVETHRRQIMEKLNIYSVAELTKYAIREGLTSIEN